jgi:hypothetical protein
MKAGDLLPALAWAELTYTHENIKGRQVSTFPVYRHTYDIKAGKLLPALACQEPTYTHAL